MKKLIMLSVLFLAVSCGPRKKVIVENNYNDSDLKNRVTDLENRVNDLESSKLNLMTQIVILEESLADLQDSDENQSSSILDLQEQLSDLEDQVASLESSIYTLQNNPSIVQIIDVCGDSPNVYDEVILMVIERGQVKYLSSFSDNSNGKNTRFSLLTPGFYTSTDGTGCLFEIKSNGNIGW